MTAPMRRLSIVLFVALALAMSLIGTLATPTRAASILVNTTADENNTDGDCSLREAIAAATNNTAVDGCGPAGELTPDTITVPAGTYLVASVLLVGDGLIDQEITIAGAGAATTIIDGGDATRVFSILAGDVILSGLTIQRGLAADGAGIMVASSGNLDLTNSVVTDSHATDGVGGGIFVDSGGDLDVTGSTISGNTATLSGGGIALNDDADATIGTSTVSGNSAAFGGGILSDGADLEITASSIINNDANYDAQGETGGEGGGIWSDGDVSLTNSTVSGNDAAVDGGGIFIDASKSIPELEIEGSTISGNSALGAGDATELEDGNGGGIWADADVSLFNSTVSGNDALCVGGGIYLDDEFMRLDFSTIASNAAPGDCDEFTSQGTGGGIYSSVGSVDLYATIVANNTDSDCGTNDASLESVGNSLDSDDSCNMEGLTDHPAGEAGLAALADNGGPTLTHALLFNSDAIDAVVELALLERPDFLLAGAVQIPLCDVGADVTHDQRGPTVGPRPVDGDGDGEAVCDIGAFELQLPSASINDVSVTEGNSGTVAATFTVTLSHGYGGTVSFSWATSNGTAAAPGDYQSASGSVSFAPGETSKPITVQVVGDTVDEPNETFTVTLSAPVNGTIADPTGTGTILDDDGGPVVTPSPTQAQLPNTGTDDALIGATGAGAALAVLVLAVAASAWIRERRGIAGRR